MLPARTLTDALDPSRTTTSRHRTTSVLRGLICLPLAAAASWGVDYADPHPFGTATPYARLADATAIGIWWKPEPGEKFPEMRQWFRTRPRDQTMAFAVYTHHKGVLKLSAQCFPLLPDEPKSVILEFLRDGAWTRADEQPVQYPGWSAHFRVTGWNGTQDAPYRVRLGTLSQFAGTIRRDPSDKKTITVASMSCNSPKDPARYARPELVRNLLRHDPDLLFFAGDQSYHHENHTYGWLQTGVQFAAVIKDRPVVSIPDDHDVGHPNLWGEDGKVSSGTEGAADGGYMFPAGYVTMVERCQTWNLPDPYDPMPVQQGIGVYYTELVLGGVSFAILEDRKFKTGPLGRIPRMGPRIDHINDPAYDRTAIDLPGLEMLGRRQLAFLDAWARDWSGAVMKCALSQTAFCGAVHLHGTANNRLLADLDCNGWPQAGRNQALKALRRARATHLCGDQHLAVMVRHGIESFRDGPWSFTNPALVNTYYGRWWWPVDGKAGGGAAIPSPLPWTGDYEDGLGNRITMVAYANPDGRRLEDTTKENRGDGYGLVRFDKEAGTVTCECWPRFADLAQGDKAQYPGWPVTFPAADNDGRTPIGHLQEVTLPVADGVVAVTRQDDGELVYCHRIRGRTFRAPVYAPGRYTVAAGPDRPQQVLLKDAEPNP